MSRRCFCSVVKVKFSEEWKLGVLSLALNATRVQGYDTWNRHRTIKLPKLFTATRTRHFQSAVIVRLFVKIEPSETRSPTGPAPHYYFQVMVSESFPLGLELYYVVKFEQGCRFYNPRSGTGSGFQPKNPYRRWNSLSYWHLNTLELNAPASTFSAQ